MGTKLERISELARTHPEMKFTTLAHLLSTGFLELCHYELPNNKATGVKRTTKEEYEENLEDNIQKLVERLKQKSYRPQPVRRTYIPKAGTDKKRPLGIPEHEDKIVQRAITKTLEAIYEEDFLDSSFGFRPNRNCHDALKILNFYLERRPINYIVDADIKGFDAQKFYRALINRLKKFNLEIAENKTKIISFGRNADSESKREGRTKPHTFDFLGFTHYCSKSQNGNFRVKRKTSSKKMRAKLKQCKQWLKENRTTDIKVIMQKLRRSLKGYYNYYCITDNTPFVSNFQDKVRSLLYKWMNRRGQCKSFNWDKFLLFMKKHPLPKPKVKISIYELRDELGYIL